MTLRNTAKFLRQNINHKRVDASELIQANLSLKDACMKEKDQKKIFTYVVDKGLVLEYIKNLV